MRAFRPGWGFIILATLLVTCLLTLASMGRPGAPAFSVLHSREKLSWLVWALLAPGVVAAARRFPFGAGTAMQWLVRHLFFGFGFSLLAVGVSTVITRSMSHAMPNTSPPVIASIATGLLIYALIAVSYQALAYHGTARSREADAAKLRADLAEARLMGLESKLQPHFLFNALNSIAALVRKDAAAAEEMLEQLSDLLRASLQANPMQEVALGDALHLTEQYLAIERVRYRDRLRIDVNVDAAARRCRVPQLLLQPLVENAVRHGIAPKEGGGWVGIGARIVSGRLIITVEDDGVGLGNARPARAGTGLGLKAIRSALTHRYGTDQRFDLTPRVPRGTIASLELPCLTA
jgi:two-component system, LytTR family, sensor kinase